MRGLVRRVFFGLIFNGLLYSAYLENINPLSCSLPPIPPDGGLLKAGTDLKTQKMLLLK